MNLGPKDYESSALTAELMARNRTKSTTLNISFLRFLVNGMGMGLNPGQTQKINVLKLRPHSLAPTFMSNFYNEFALKCAVYHLAFFRNFK